MVESYVRQRPEGAAPQPRGTVCLGEAAARCAASRPASAQSSAGLRERRYFLHCGLCPVASEDEEEYGIEGGPLLSSGLLPLDLRCCPQARPWIVYCKFSIRRYHHHALPTRCTSEPHVWQMEI